MVVDVVVDVVIVRYGARCSSHNGHESHGWLNRNCCGNTILYKDSSKKPSLNQEVTHTGSNRKNGMIICKGKNNELKNEWQSNNKQKRMAECWIELKKSVILSDRAIEDVRPCIYIIA
jgi:hypothetical protein